MKFLIGKTAISNQCFLSHRIGWRKIKNEGPLQKGFISESYTRTDSVVQVIIRHWHVKYLIEIGVFGIFKELKFQFFIT